MIVIEGARIFDGTRMLGPGTVEVRDGVISRVAVGAGPDEPPAADPREGAEVVDGTGRTLLPGLIDAHTHTFGAEANLEQALAFGVTTEVDMFLYPPELTQALCATAHARDDLADMISSGIVAGAPGGLPGFIFTDLPTLAGPEAAEEFVAARQAEGAHFIKIIVDDGAHHGLALPFLDRACVAAVVDAAHRRGLLTVAHISGAWSAELAADAGVDILTHLPLEAELPESFARRLAAEGQTVIPTMTIMEMSVGGEHGRALAADSRLHRYLGAEARAAVAEGTEGLAVPHAAPEHRFAHVLTTARRMQLAGVELLAGTDANSAPGRACPVVHGVSMHAELELLVAAGMSPAQALAAATSGPAARFGLEDRGVLAPGRRGDLLLVDGDPTEEITHTRAIAGVWRRGVRFDHAAYRRRFAPEPAAAAEAGVAT